MSDEKRCANCNQPILHSQGHSKYFDGTIERFYCADCRSIFFAAAKEDKPVIHPIEKIRFSSENSIFVNLSFLAALLRKSTKPILRVNEDVLRFQLVNYIHIEYLRKALFDAIGLSAEERERVLLITDEGRYESTQYIVYETASGETFYLCSWYF